MNGPQSFSIKVIKRGLKKFKQFFTSSKKNLKILLKCLGSGSGAIVNPNTFHPKEIFITEEYTGKGTGQVISSDSHWNDIFLKLKIVLTFLQKSASHFQFSKISFLLKRKLKFCDFEIRTFNIFAIPGSKTKILVWKYFFKDLTWF